MDEHLAKLKKINQTEHPNPSQTLTSAGEKHELNQQSDFDFGINYLSLLDPSQIASPPPNYSMEGH